MRVQNIHYELCRCYFSCKAIFIIVAAPQYDVTLILLCAHVTLSQRYQLLVRLNFFLILLMAALTIQQLNGS